ncbi:hypothetical protein B0H11DRAFT_2399714 [Mycena galericulata]|nr:hypothetical protein B0H11DRAFT_2399714 [Mycena galericulata]
MNTLLLYVFLALFSTTARTAPLQKRGNVAEFCLSLVFSGNALSANCLNAAGRSLIPSTIPLDSCIGNSNGELGAGENFSIKCSEIALTKLELGAVCANSSGIAVGTQVNLDTVLTTIDGILACSSVA